LTSSDSTYAGLSVWTPLGTGVRIISGSAFADDDAHGIEIESNGSGHGVKIRQDNPSAPAGNALNISALGNHAINVGVSGDNFDGLNIYSAGGHGISVTSAGAGTVNKDAVYLRTQDGNALSLVASGGHGINATSSSGSFNGIYVEGAPLGAGLKIDAGGSIGDAVELIAGPFEGHGISITTGFDSPDDGINIVSTGGTGIKVVSATTDAVSLVAGGAAGHGLSTTGSGTGDGIYTLIDGARFSYILELQMARVNGAYLLNTGVDDLTMYKRDNSTPLTVVNVSPTGRTRVS